MYVQMLWLGFMHCVAYLVFKCSVWLHAIRCAQYVHWYLVLYEFHMMRPMPCVICMKYTLSTIIHLTLCPADTCLHKCCVFFMRMRIPELSWRIMCMRCTYMQPRFNLVCTLPRFNLLCILCRYG